MAETPNSPAAVTPAQAGPAQPESFQVPTGKALIDATEYETLRRNNERIRGMEPFYQKASSLGFKKPEDFAKYEKFSGALKSRNLTLEQLAMAFDEPDQPESKGGGDIDLAALEKRLLSEAEKRVEQRFTRKDAESAHRASLEKVDGVLKSMVEEAIGSDATDFEKSLALKALKADLYAKRSLYPDDHPLHDFDYAPPGEDGVKALVEEFKSSRAAARGGQVSDKAAAIAKSVRTTPAGATGTTSKPPKGDEDDDRPGGLPAKSKVEAMAAKLQAARKGSPLSSLRS